jgi:hypothetical protein
MTRYKIRRSSGQREARDLHERGLLPAVPFYDGNSYIFLTICICPSDPAVSGQRGPLHIFSSFLLSALVL